MNRPSRNEIETSLSDAKHETPVRVDRSSLDLPTKDSHRHSRVIGGNLDGVSRHVPKRNYTGWIIAACLVLFSGLLFVIPEFTNKSPKIAQNKPTAPANDLYDQNIEKTANDEPTDSDENSFTIPDDRNRVADYRQTELLQQKLLALKTKAEAAIAKGDYTNPTKDNALIYYQEMLALDGNNIAATDGINYMLNRLLTVGNEMLIADDMTTAKRAQQSLAEIDIDSVEYLDLSEAISAYEVEQKQKVLNQKIAALFEQADQAVSKNNLIKPNKQNAVFYYQEILKLDSKNNKARQGIETIRQSYADLAEQQINESQWDEAKTTIKNLRLASEDSVLATFLSKRLEEAKSRPEPEPTAEENIAENTSTPVQDETTVFAPFPTNSNSDSAQAQNNTDSEPQISASESNNSSQAPIKDLSISANDTTIAQRERESFRAVAPVTDALNPTQNNEQNIANQNNPNTATTNSPNVPAAANTNQNQQQLNTGLQAYYSGEYITAFSNLAPLAEKNNTRAQIRVGYMYQFGRGVAQDQTLGSQYLRTALPDLIKRAQQSQSWAQSDLGSLYEDGIIVTQSYDEALNWYRKAAAQNYAGAQTNLGNMYFFGKGVQQSQDEAIKWYRLAALGGDAIAKQNLIQLNAVSF